MGFALLAGKWFRLCGQGPCQISGMISASIYLSYRFAERIGRTLGDSAMNVIIRISSFILVCIGVQILWNGLSALLRTVVR